MKHIEVVMQELNIGNYPDNVIGYTVPWALGTHGINAVYTVEANPKGTVSLRFIKREGVVYVDNQSLGYVRDLAGWTDVLPYEIVIFDRVLSYER